MSDQQRPTLTAKKLDRNALAAMDVQHLWQQPQFKRFLFTLIDHANINRGTYGTGQHLAYSEGRKSLVFDILRTVERHAPGIGALAQIYSEENSTPVESPNVRSKYDRHRELGSDGDPDRVDRPVFLDYGNQDG